MSIKNFRELEEFVQKKSKEKLLKVAVMCAEDEEVLEALSEAVKNKVAGAYLVGDKTKIIEIAQSHKINIDGMEIIDKPDHIEAGIECTNLVNSGKAAIMMKGLVGSADFLRPILNKETGLRTGSVLSHIAVFELDTYHKLLAVTDAAVNIKPDIEVKKSIINNVANVMNFLGIEKPKVAACAAVEKVNQDKMPATYEAAELSKLAKEGALGNVYLDGPFALDVAISKHAAEVKKLNHLDVPGDADIILADDIESGNILYKSLSNLVPGKSCAIVSGAKVPLVLTSRSDTHEAKYYSIVLAVAVA